MEVEYPVFIQARDDLHWDEVPDPRYLDPSNYEMQDVLDKNYGYHGWDSGATYYVVKWDRLHYKPYLEKVKTNDIEGFQAALNAVLGTSEESSVPLSTRLSKRQIEAIQRTEQFYQRMQDVIDKCKRLSESEGDT